MSPVFIPLKIERIGRVSNVRCFGDSVAHRTLVGLRAYRSLFPFGRDALSPRHRCVSCSGIKVTEAADQQPNTSCIIYINLRMRMG